MCRSKFSITQRLSSRRILYGNARQQVTRLSPSHHPRCNNAFVGSILSADRSQNRIESFNNQKQTITLTLYVEMTWTARLLYFHVKIDLSILSICTQNCFTKRVYVFFDKRSKSHINRSSGLNPWIFTGILRKQIFQSKALTISARK